MPSIKEQSRKRYLVKAKKSNKRVPVWVMMKTNRKVSANPQQRSWRFGKLGKEIAKKERDAK